MVDWHSDRESALDTFIGDVFRASQRCYGDVEWGPGRWCKAVQLVR